LKSTKVLFSSGALEVKEGKLAFVVHYYTQTTVKFKQKSFNAVSNINYVVDENGSAWCQSSPIKTYIPFRVAYAALF